MNLDNYFKKLNEDIDIEYKIANEARKKGFDPEKKVETTIALTLAEKSVALIKTIYPNLSIKKISNRIIELEEKYGKLDATVSFVIAREIADEKFLKFKDKLEAIDCGIRIGFSYMTLGVVASPIEGYTGIRLGKTKENKDYFIVNFSGPIRSAGTTATCLILMLIDYLREYFGYSKYDPSENEINRYVQENIDYHERVTNLQYLPTEEEMRILASNLPIQISGDPTEKKEVSNYKDLKRVETNFLRGGMCLVFSEGLAQKAGKALGRLKSVKENGFNSSGWDFLEEYEVIHKKRISGNIETEATYIKDLVAGRPVYGHPSASGAFRLRYGRGRTSGFSAFSVHPATMGVTDGFLSNGTQLKIEALSKGGIVTSCDSIDGPIVKLKNGSVKKLDSFEESKKLSPEIEEIIYLGDLLFPVGDVIDRNAVLLKPGYVEEWWSEESKIDYSEVDFEKAVDISIKNKIPLHPKFIFYWSQINQEHFFHLCNWINSSEWRNEKLVFPWNDSVKDKYKIAKRTLEILGVNHIVHMDNVVVEMDAESFLFNLGIRKPHNGIKFFLKANEVDERGVLEIINEMCLVEIKDKAGSFIGARMGRPEKAKLRHLTGSPNVLFPLGNQGGRLKSLQTAMDVGPLKGEFSVYKCDCGNETIYPICENCKKFTQKMFYCKDCDEIKNQPCNLHKNTAEYKFFKLDLKKYFDIEVKRMGLKIHEIPPIIKGVNKVSNHSRSVENLTKGILRSKYNLSVNRDGTIRYDGTEIPITHFKPKEIGISVEKLRELGYIKDIHEKDLEKDNQILELMPHDVILPSCPETQDERADEAFLNIANFIDDELSKLYGLDKFYNLKEKSDLIGKKIVCMSPHNCAGVVGRIIGWTKIQGIVASPY